jgi:hypothetical protein
MNIRKQMSAGLGLLGTIAATMVLVTPPTLAAGVLPGVGTEAASNVAKTSAALNGTVHPENTTVSDCAFEYGPEPGYYPSSIPCAQSLPLLGGGAVPVSATLGGLSASTVYHYRLTATNAEGTSQGEDQSFTTPAAVDALSTGAATDVTTVSVALAGSLAPDGADAHYFFEYGINESYGSRTATEDAGMLSASQALSVPVGGLLPNQTYHFRLVAENSFGTTYGADETVHTLGVLPVIERPGATLAVTRATALLEATLRAGNDSVTYWFEYGTTEAYGIRGAVTELGTSSTPEAVRTPLGDLTPGALYHYRLVVSNSTGTVRGADETFTTADAAAPIVLTGGASSIGQNSATIAGVVDSQGEATTYGFEVGELGGYGSPVGLGGIAAGQEALTVTLAGLTPGTTYHYRVVASNLDGTSYGPDQAFTTLGVPAQLTVPVAPILIAVPAVKFPTGGSSTAKPKSKALTKAQKLTAALRICARKPRAKRAPCQRQAHAKFGARKVKGKVKGK